MHMSLKIGIIGFGGMAHWHATNASKIEGVDFVAAYDVDEKQLQSAQEEFGMRPCRTLEELLSIPEINFVLVATPNQIHKDMVIAALRAGKHVMTEKPATLSVADWTSLYRNLVDVIDNGAELIVKPEQVRRVLQLNEAIFASAKSGHSVACAI